MRKSNIKLSKELHFNSHDEAAAYFGKKEFGELKFCGTIDDYHVYRWECSNGIAYSMDIAFDGRFAIIQIDIEANKNF